MWYIAHLRCQSSDALWCNLFWKNEKSEHVSKVSNLSSVLCHVTSVWLPIMAPLMAISHGFLTVVFETCVPKWTSDLPFFFFFSSFFPCLFGFFLHLFLRNAHASVFGSPVTSRKVSLAAVLKLCGPFRRAFPSSIGLMGNNTLLWWIAWSWEGWGWNKNQRCFPTLCYFLEALCANGMNSGHALEKKQKKGTGYSSGLNQITL